MCNHSDPFGLFASSCCVIPISGALPPPPPIPQQVINEAARALESAAASINDAIDGLKDRIQLRLVTYTRVGPDGQVYSGRTRGFGHPQAIVEARARRHPERLRHFAPPTYDVWAPFSFEALIAIRGREQQLIDAHGGAQTEGGTSANIGREINRAASPIFEAAATRMFGSPPLPRP